MRVDPRIDAIVDDNIPNGLRFEDTENCAYTDNTYKIIEYHRQRKEIPSLSDRYGSGL